MNVRFYLSFDTIITWVHIFGVKNVKIVHTTLLWTSLHNITKYVNHQRFINFNTWRFTTPWFDVVISSLTN